MAGTEINSREYKTCQHMEWYQMSESLELRKVKFIGLSISIFELSELKKYIKNVVEHNAAKVMYGYSLWTITALKKYPELYKYAEQSDVLVTDGRPFFLLAKFHGLPLKHDISIPNLVFLTLDLANKNGWSVFLLGADKQINEKAQINVRKKYSNIKNIDGIDGYYSSDQSEEIKKKIKKFAPNILLIGTSSPDKERIAVEWKNSVNANIIIPCGGMIDVLGGKTKVTPVLLKKLGLASFYRLSQEPRRLYKKMITVYSFILFKFIPLYFYYVLFLNNQKFSIYDYFHKKPNA